MVRVAMIYALMGFGAVQVANNFFFALDLPAWIAKLVAAIVLIGFPVALALAWAFDRPTRTRSERETAPDTTEVQPVSRARAALLVSAGIAAALGVGYLLYSGPLRGVFRAEPEPGRSIAVLPFENMGADPDTEYFSDGVTEDVITQLSKLDDLKVISRTSIMQYKDNDKPLRQIAEELDVATVLEGSVRREGERVRIVAQLIDARTDDHLWAETYDRDVHDIFDIQSDVARKITTALDFHLSPDQRERIERKPTTDLEAYDLYLQGRYFWNKRTPESLQTAIGLFEQAIARDGTFAEAWAGLADVYVVLPFHEREPLTDELDRARDAAEHALSLDPRLGEAHAVLANVAWYQWRWDDAERSFHRGLELNPGHATGHQWYAEFLAARGETEAAEQRMVRAVQLDPLSRIVNTDLGTIRYYARRYDDAIAQLRATLEIDSTFAHAWRELANAYEMAGRYTEALEASDHARQLRGVTLQPVSLSRQSFAQQPTAQKYFRLMLAETQPPEAMSPVSRARWHASLGETNAALRDLDQAVSDRDALVPFISVEPAFDSIREEPRFEDLLERIGLRQGRG